MMHRFLPATWRRYREAVAELREWQRYERAQAAEHDEVVARILAGVPAVTDDGGRSWR